jgi:translation initiation factor 2 beta subunit (eIF-2beta)/eIF-5
MWFMSHDYHSDKFVTCKKCDNVKAYLWFDRRLRIYLISCDSCGVYDDVGRD